MKEKHKQPTVLEPGIYFNLSEHLYHADPALSHGGMVDLLIHPLQYWENGPLNPHREFKETDAMLFGKRCHQLLLEPDNFFKEYAVQGGKDFNAKKRFITRNDFRNISDSVDMIKSVPSAYEYFTNGYAEVSIIWDDPETGIRLRARIDWLRSFGGIDYKRAKNIENNPLGWTISDFGYDIQAALYVDGIKEIKRLLKKRKVKAFGLHDSKWLDKFIADEDALFCFFFQRSTRPYVFRILSFDEEIMNNARQRVYEAKHIYKANIEAFGTDKWPAGSAEPEEFSVYNLPRRIFDQGVK